MPKGLDDELNINIGCGSDIRPGFIHIDIQPLDGVDHVQNAWDLHQFEDETVDFIVAQHLLEYIPRGKLIETFEEWYRVLAITGRIEVRVTDLVVLLQELQKTEITDEMVLALIYGRQINEHDIRLMGYTQDYLVKIAAGAGLQVENAEIEGFDTVITFYGKDTEVNV